MAGGVRSTPAFQVRAVSGFKIRQRTCQSRARVWRPVGERGSTTSSIKASPTWSGLRKKNGGARNEVPQFPRSFTSADGRQLKPTFGLNVLPASL
jgi:hypothetical protein